jgi:group I intron endonuclease
MTDVIHGDFETRGVVPFGKHKENAGLYNYASHPQTEAAMFAWSVNEAKISLWEILQGEPIPKILDEAIDDPQVMFASWNSAFERNIFFWVLKRNIPVSRWLDPQASARYLSLPDSLETAAIALGLPPEFQKDKKGKQLIKIFSELTIPRKVRAKKGVIPEQPKPYFRDWKTDPEKWGDFGNYCVQDVATEREIARRLKVFGVYPLPEREQRIWELDQKINDLGMPTDRSFVQKNFAIGVEAKRQASDKLKALTGLENPNSDSQMLAWVRERGYKYNFLRKEYVALSLDDEENPLSDEVRKVLEIRKVSRSMSYKKLSTIERQLSPDDRLRNQFVFMGSSRAGRWCLSENTQVTVKTVDGVVSNKPIVSVLMTDLVWDGVAWVNHGGVVFSGEKETVKWDTIEATLEHNVWVNSVEKMPLSSAIDKGLSLWRGDQKYSIYKIISPSGKFYIGLTKSKVSERWRQHKKKAAKAESNHPFYNAIRKYGSKSFDVQVLDFASNEKQAQQLEKKYIAEANQELLYNLSPGGESDGAVGGHIFWSRIRQDPNALKAYLNKLSKVKKENDWSDYPAMQLAREEWHKTHRREAYEIGRRNIRAANKNRFRRPKVEYSLDERLFRKWKPEEVARQNAVAQWKNRSLKEVQDISDKISDSQKKAWALKSLKDRQSIMSEVRKNVDRKKQGVAASVGLKSFWVDLKADPIRYKEFMLRRQQGRKN